jgi:hypothetical protein
MNRCRANSLISGERHCATKSTEEEFASIHARIMGLLKTSVKKNVEALGNKL